jgi:radical SAM protein with 4Fe4S-binding SPASM domain
MTNGKHVPESILTKQRVQFKMARITPASAEDIGRSIKRDVINIAAANEKEFWPMQSGVRFPNEKCPNCAMRGICSGNAELRDSLVTRKQLDEFDFGKESE